MRILILLILSFNALANDLDDAFVSSVNKSNYVLVNPTGSEDYIFKKLFRETLKSRGSNADNISISIPIDGALNHISNFIGNSFVGKHGWDNKSDFYRYFVFERKLNGRTFIYNCYANIDALKSSGKIQYSMNLSSCESKLKSGVGESIGFDIQEPFLSPVLNRVSDELRDAQNRGGSWGKGTRPSSSGSTRE